MATLSLRHVQKIYPMRDEDKAKKKRKKKGEEPAEKKSYTLKITSEGVVAVDVWTGYAINVVSKSGDREVVIGPATRLFDYDETVEAITVTHGDKEEVTAFLKTENNKVSDIINAQTADFVDVQIKLSYYVDFLEDYKDSWFTVNNYAKYLCDNMHSLIKREIRTYNIKDFYADSTEIIRNIVLDINAATEATDKPFGRLFRTNGMLVNDVDIIGIGVEKDIAMILEKHQNELIQKSVELADAAARMEVITALADVKKREAELNNETALYALELEQKRTEEEMHNEEMIRAKKREAKAAEVQAQNDLQDILTAIQSAEMARIKEKQDAEIAHAKELAEIEKAKQEAYAATVKEIMSSIQPDLVAAISASTQAELLKEGMASISPYAIANGESVADTVNKLLRGTSLEEIINVKG